MLGDFTLNANTESADLQTRMTVLADLACEISAILGQDPMQGLREALRRRRKSRRRRGRRGGRGRRANRGGDDLAEPEDPQMQSNFFNFGGGY